MKKTILSLILVFSFGLMSYAVNMPTGPVSSTPSSSGSTEGAYKKNSATSQPNVPVTNRTIPTSSGSYGGSSVSATAQQLAKAMLNGNDYVEYYQKLMKAGAKDIKLETHENACPRRKGIPPVSLGGKTYTGKRCSFVKYTYNGQATGTGACIK